MPLIISWGRMWSERCCYGFGRGVDAQAMSVFHIELCVFYVFFC